MSSDNQLSDALLGAIEPVASSAPTSQLADEQLSTELLETAAESVAAGLDVPALAQRILTLLCQRLAILRGEIFAVDRAGALSLLAFSGYTEEQHHLLTELLAEMRLQKGLAKVVAERNQPLVLPDVNCSEEWLPIPGLDDDICSAAALPLYVDGNLVGVISLLSNESDYFTTARIRQLQALMTPLALTLHTTILFAQVCKDQAQLQQLTVELVNTQEAERKRIAQELHNEVGQTLAGIKGTLLVLQKTLPESTAHLAQQLDLPITLADESMGHVRRLAYALRPPVLDLLGLDAALEALCQELTRRSPFPIHYQGATTPGLADELNTVCYRFVQEVLTDIGSHAGLHEVDVQLTLGAELLTITIRAQHCTFLLPAAPPTSQASARLDLRTLRERFAALHGRLQFTPGEQSTIITASVPLLLSSTRQ